MGLNYMPLPNEFYSECEMLDAAEYGRLIRAGQQYVINGTIPELEGNEKFLWNRLKGLIDRYAAVEEKKSAAKSSAGKKGMASRWGNSKKVEDSQPEEAEISDNSVIPVITDDNSVISVITDDNKITNKTKHNITQHTLKERVKKESTDNVTELIVEQADDGFDQFWDEYPRHVAKQVAEKAWDKLKPDEELRLKIISALRIQKQSQQWQNIQYVPHPATWLNQRRWEDENPVQSTQSSHIGIDRSMSNGVPGQHEKDAVARLIRQHKGGAM